jgi:hypothetical protein
MWDLRHWLTIIYDVVCLMPTLKKETAGSWETFMPIYQTTQLQNPYNCSLNIRRAEEACYSESKTVLNVSWPDSDLHHYVFIAFPTYAGKCRDSSVVIATGWTVEVRFSPGVRDFFFFFNFASSRPALGPTLPPISCVPCAISPGIKLPGRLADHSPSSNAEVNNGGAMHTLPHMTLN